MPKNAHGPRGNTKKKPPPTAVAEEDDNLLIFTTDKPKPKREVTDTNIKAGGSQSAAGDGAAAADSADVSKKPDVKKLIGGSSWTGKLPVNMLQEHCQKQRWAKPEYTMVR